MKGQYIVAGYQGNMSIRFVPDNSTTVYMDSELASFDNEVDALAYIDQHEADYHADYWGDDEGDDEGDDTLAYFACDCCGELHSKDCQCDDIEF